MFASGFLANVGWRKKILGISALFVLIIIAIGVLGGYNIYQLNHSTLSMFNDFQARVTAATNSRAAIQEMARAQAELIAAQERQDTRKGAVDAIRASSLLDENLQHLSAILHDSTDVQELVQLLEQIKPKKMELIRAARANQDEMAMSINREMQDKINRINELSGSIVEKERQGMVESMEQWQQRGNRVVWLLGGFSLIGILIAVLVSLVQAHMVTKPLSLLENSMAALATGDLKISFPSAGKDEIGRTVSAMSQTVTNLHVIIKKIHDGGIKLSGEAANVTNTADGIHGVSARLHDAIAAIKTEAEVVVNASSNSVSKLSATADTAKNTAQFTRKTSKQIVDTVQQFKNFQHNMENTANVTRELAQTAAAITTITKTIRDISAQTNLLALNAAIEAARAGEHGRGFAVVADEVRTLATRTDSATDEISTLVETISSSVQHAVKMLETSVKEAHDNIALLQEVADETGGSSEKADTMHHEMQHVLQMIGDQEQSIQSINSAVNGLYELSEETNRQTDLLHDLSQALKGEATVLNTVVDKFKL
jgi:methyl-accepting chemotaxis protein